MSTPSMLNFLLWVGEGGGEGDGDDGDGGVSNDP